MANKSYIIYNGPSLIDGQPIVCIAQVSTTNRKTGDMIQTFIIRSDIDPITASRIGADYSICGNCPHRGTPTNLDKGQAKGRTCYVTLAHAPLGKYKAFKRGLYPTVTGHVDIAAIGRGQMVRLGTYGDMSAVPSYVTESLLSEAKGWTAYTHQNDCATAATNPAVYMTSAESASEAQAAWGRGERTFRILADQADLISGKEILCPASDEAGKRTTCDRCKLCAGASVKAKSIAIVAHGTAKKAARELVAA